MTGFLHYKQRFLKITSVSVVTAFALSIAAPLTTLAAPDITNNDLAVNATEISQALKNTPGVIAAADQTTITSDADSALKTGSTGMSLDVPKDASDGIELTGAAQLRIDMPSADQAKDATKVAPGTVAYAGKDGSANAVQATEDGGLRMLTIIDNDSAPTAYTYNVDVPEGGYITLTADGGAVVVDHTNQLLVTVDKPWAKDANGKQVATHFTTDGHALTQHVAHNTPGVAYPVTADPKISWGWSGVTMYLNRNETRAAGVGAGAAGVYLRLAGIPGLAFYAVSVAADWAADRGLCLAVTKNYVGHYFRTWTYKC